MASIQYGDQWIDSLACAIHEVPSIVVPEQYNVLIHPTHPDTAGIRARIRRKWLYDLRLR